MSFTPQERKINVLMCGAGEYNVGLVLTGAGAAPDKSAGVVAIVLFDLRRRGLLGRILLADADGHRIPLAKQVMNEKIGQAYKDMDVTVETWPKDETISLDLQACPSAMDTLLPGDAVIIFTPDSTHFSLASAAIARGLHVLVAKPVVKILKEHLELQEAAAKAGVICAVEYHKRWDPIFLDARERARKLGNFSFFSSTMTQRKVQLDTFAGWAGKASDISYYLNSHFIDICCWALEGRARPEQVSAMASTGIANARLGRSGIEDTITLMVSFRNADDSTGHALFTASWVAPTADCHTQQSYHYVGARGELRVDQAHRGYTFSEDPIDKTGSLATINPLYMRYIPDANGYFAGQQGYGYRSIEAFVMAAQGIENKSLSLNEASSNLASVAQTLPVTAILEAGRRSLDAGGRAIKILYDGEAKSTPEVPVDVFAIPTGFSLLA
jgi:D-galacturonate reductase